MSDPAIIVRNVSKKYRLFDSPQDRLKEALHPFAKRYHREFWALRDVSFEVPRGQTVGILGRNGSGKSTLLQIIAGIMKPTSGEVTVNGRVSALLELGAGFNPEFTGRGNVIFQAQVMGLAQQDIERKLSEIEAFADIGEFFDQPVKTYSSGMFLRVAFAAATFVEPDILIVDEALAVGDVLFQQKCFRTFEQLQEKGSTILIVTHSPEAIARHCDRAILLEDARVLIDGIPKDVIDCYLEVMFTGRLGSYTAVPTLVEEGFAGFNLCHYQKEYVAVAQRLGQFDLSNASKEKIVELKARGDLHTAASLNELRAIFSEGGKAAGGSGGIAPIEQSGQDRVEQSTDLHLFCESFVAEDCCVARRSYSSSEYRYGDRRGEIVDYLFMTGDSADPMLVESDAKCAIYMKVRFFSDIDRPVFGMAIKTTDGQTVSGLNTMMQGATLSPVMRDQTVVVKFEWDARLNAGDYFIDLGCAEDTGAELVPLDRRYGVIHLIVTSRSKFSGFANLGASISEVCRVAT